MREEDLNEFERKVREGDQCKFLPALAKAIKECADNQFPNIKSALERRAHLIDQAKLLTKRPRTSAEAIATKTDPDNLKITLMSLGKRER